VPEAVLFMLPAMGSVAFGVTATKLKCKTSITLIKHADLNLLLMGYTNAIYRYRYSKRYIALLSSPAFWQAD
jgi:hypothetical protein